MLKLISSTAAALALAAPVWAQTAADSAMTDPGQVVGQEVRTADGEMLGPVREIIWGQNQQISGVIVSPDESLGAYQGNVALDWDDMFVAPGEPGLVANLTRSQLMGMPQTGTMGSAGTMGTGDTAGAAGDAEVPDISESQPGVITGDDVDERETSPAAGQGATD